MADDDEKGEAVVGIDEETENEKKIHKDGQKADNNNKSKTVEDNDESQTIDDKNESQTIDENRK